MSIDGFNRLPRQLTALVGLCYLILSFALPFQHLHHTGEDGALPTRVAASARAGDAHSHAVQMKAAKRCSVASHCASCDWQAANVSPAVPLFTLVLTPPQAPRAITTFPRYLPFRSISTPSRAPPFV